MWPLVALSPIMVGLMTWLPVRAHFRVRSGIGGAGRMDVSEVTGRHKAELLSASHPGGVCFHRVSPFVACVWLLWAGSLRGCSGIRGEGSIPVPLPPPNPHTSPPITLIDRTSRLKKDLPLVKRLPVGPLRETVPTFASGMKGGSIHRQWTEYSRRPNQGRVRGALFPTCRPKPSRRKRSLLISKRPH
jgi:hypothetical protein